MTAFKLVTVALLGDDVIGKKSLAELLTQAFASMPAATFPANAPLRWQITTETPLQRLLERIQASKTHPDNLDLDTESTEFHTALAQQRNFDHTLLLGLDLMQPVLALQPQSAVERSRMDMLLRRSLTQAEVPFQVIYGSGNERLRQALTALKSPEAPLETPPRETSHPLKPWVWACDKCSDPSCEHKLLSDLLLNR